MKNTFRRVVAMVLMVCMLSGSIGPANFMALTARAEETAGDGAKSGGWIPLPGFSPMPGVEFARAFRRLGPKPVETAARRGEYLADYTPWPSSELNGREMAGRADALSWDLENDGVGNPKNTKSLLYAHETPPSMITGVRADAETAVRAGVVHILFGSLPEEDCAAIDEYLKSLRPVPSPRLEGGELNASARRGKILFESSRTRCASCHPEPLYTDLSMHATGSQDFKEPRTRFDTPTLVVDTGMSAGLLYQTLYYDGTYLYWGRMGDNTAELIIINPTSKAIYHAGDFGDGVPGTRKRPRPERRDRPRGSSSRFSALTQKSRRG